MPLIDIPKDARKGKEPCGECQLKYGETCDICGARQTGDQSTKEMRARIRELARPNECDYDRAVICVLNDLEARMEE